MLTPRAIAVFLKSSFVRASIRNLIPRAEYNNRRSPYFIAKTESSYVGVRRISGRQTALPFSARIFVPTNTAAEIRWTRKHNNIHRPREGQECDEWFRCFPQEMLKTWRLEMPFVVSSLEKKNLRNWLEKSPDVDICPSRLPYLPNWEVTSLFSACFSFHDVRNFQLWTMINAGLMEITKAWIGDEC